MITQDRKDPSIPDSWWIYRGGQEGSSVRTIADLPSPPPWRDFTDPNWREQMGAKFQVEEKEKELVNAALYLRRPLLVTGKPGIGKTSLAKSVARELELGTLLEWHVNSRSTVREALYHYDVIGRLHARQLENEIPPVEEFIQLGPLGTAFLPSSRPRALLIDEIDKGDIDLPNDLLRLFEEGRFEIPELLREESRRKKQTAQTSAENGQESPSSPSTFAVRDYADQMHTLQIASIVCNQFPFVVITSNGERELPGPFLRRCITLEIDRPSKAKLLEIVKAHFGDSDRTEIDDMITQFVARREKGHLATDQLLNAIYLRRTFREMPPEKLIDALWRNLTSG